MTPDALLTEAGYRPQARNPVAANVAGLVALLVVLAFVAYPLGLACHGIYWLFMQGWGVIG